MNSFLQKPNLRKVFGKFWGLSSFLLIFLTINSVNAASLFFSPSSGTHEVGDQFSVRVTVSSNDQEINAASANISFSSDKLQLISATKGGSIIDFWVQEPTVTNQNTRVSFEGVDLDGYQGASGGLATLTFKAISLGSANISFASASVLANDGIGTNILQSSNGANYTLVEKTVEEEQVEEPKVVKEETVPTDSGSLLITSSTHPDQEKWYSNNDPVLNWNLPKGITDVDIALSEDESASFSSSDDGQGLISNVSYKDLEEGTHYIHIIYKIGETWGDKYSFKFNIDTEKPEDFSIQEIYRSIGEGKKASFTFETTDATSGVDHYSIFIDGKFIEDWVDDGSHIYLTPKLRAGSHTILVKAVDKAGNDSSADFTFGIIGGAGLDTGSYIGIGIIILLILLNGILFRRYEMLKEEYESLPSVKKRKGKEKKKIQSDRRLRQELKAEIALINTLHGKLADIEDQLRKANERINKRLEEKGK